MATVSEALKNTFDSARTRLVGLEKGVAKLERRAKSSLGEIQSRLDGAPRRLEGAWTGFVAKVRPQFATREELQKLADKVEELSARVDKLSHARRKPAAS